jgi:hypothetical protein
LAIPLTGQFQATPLQASKITRLFTQHLCGIRIAHVSGNDVALIVLNFHLELAKKTVQPKQHGLAFANFAVNQQPKCRMAASSNVSDVTWRFSSQERFSSVTESCPYNVWKQGGNPPCGTHLIKLSTQ